MFPEGLGRAFLLWMSSVCSGGSRIRIWVATCHSTSSSSLSCQLALNYLSILASSAVGHCGRRVRRNRGGSSRAQGYHDRGKRPKASGHHHCHLPAPHGAVPVGPGSSFLLMCETSDVQSIFGFADAQARLAGAAYPGDALGAGRDRNGLGRADDAASFRSLPGSVG